MRAREPYGTLFGVIEPAPANTRERSVEILDVVGNIGYPVDIIVMRTERSNAPNE